MIQNQFTIDELYVPSTELEKYLINNRFRVYANGYTYQREFRHNNAYIGKIIVHQVKGEIVFFGADINYETKYKDEDFYDFYNGVKIFNDIVKEIYEHIFQDDYEIN